MKQSTIIVETDAYRFLCCALIGFVGFVGYHLLGPVVQVPYQPAALFFFFPLEWSLCCFIGYQDTRPKHGHCLRSARAFPTIPSQNVCLLIFSSYPTT